MKNQCILSPSILAADFACLGEEVRAAVRGGAEYIHFDVMDGAYVPSISFGMPVLKSVRSVTDRKLDVHLMIMEPERYIEEFVRCGADLITVHLETLQDPERTFRMIRSLGVKAGVAINPETSVHTVIPYLSMVDMVLIMTVRPGFGGQKYLDSCTEKIRIVRDAITQKGLSTDVEVDGGINDDTLPIVLEAGANVIVMGSSVFRGDAYENAKHFMEMLKNR
ncbi:MAG: ribulose-phosphate 3-epimerase [Lachnospiraceae bacterium]